MSAHDLLSTRLCDWPGCPDDAAPDRLRCTRHERLQSSGTTIPPPARCAECNARLTGPHSEACSSYVRMRDEPLPAERCKRDGCSEPATAHSLSLRSNRYRALCEQHYEAELTKARKPQAVRIAPLVGQGGEAADPLAGEGPGSAPPLLPPSGALDLETASAPVTSPPDDQRRGHADDCMLDADHDGDCYVPGKSDGTPAAWTPERIPPEGWGQAPVVQPTMFELPAHLRVIPPHLRPRLEGVSLPAGEPVTWAERAAQLAEVGALIDRLEADLAEARYRWDSLAVPFGE